MAKHPRGTPAQDKLNKNAKDILHLRNQGVGIRLVAEKYTTSSVTLFYWFKKRFGESWGEGKTGRKEVFSDKQVIAAAKKHTTTIEAAKSIGMSVPGYQRRFKQVMNMSWSDYRAAQNKLLGFADLRKKFSKQLRKQTPHDRNKMLIKLRRQGYTYKVLGDLVGVSESTVCRIIKATH